MGKVAGQLLWRVDAAPGGAQDLNRDRGEPPILEEPLMRRRVVGPDERVMALLEFRRRAGQGELIVVETPLDVRGCLESCIMGAEMLRHLVLLRDGEEVRSCQLSARPMRQI